MKKILIFITGLILIVAGCNRSGYYRNPVLASGADPWVVKHNGKYYYCCSLDNGIGISESDVLHRINPPKQVWKAPSGSDAWNASCIWAPELHFFDGHWYVYYAAGKEGPPFVHQKSGVLESETADPFSTYTDRGMLFTGDSLNDWQNNRWAIDLTPFEHNGLLYAVWSGWENEETTDKTQQHLYIARMENPWTIGSGRVKISSPDRGYEQGELPLNEGPQILKHGNELFIIYSCGQSWLDTYKLSCLRLTSGADPLLPESWTKSEEPVFEGTTDVYGVGHACFTVSPDGKENYIIYHTKTDKEPGWKRDVRMQRFSFKENGMPEFGIPAPLSVKLPLPSGTAE